MTPLGADPQQLRALASQFEVEASAIDRAKSETTNRLHQSFWQGGDASRFSEEWFGQHSLRLNDIVVMLRNSAASLREQAVRQENVSGY